MSPGTPHYEEDFYAWTQEQRRRLLREGKWPRSTASTSLRRSKTWDAVRGRNSLLSGGAGFHLLMELSAELSWSVVGAIALKKTRACIPECLEESPSLRPHPHCVVGDYRRPSSSSKALTA